MNETGEGQNPIETQVDIDEGCELTKENFASFVKEVGQVRFVRSEDQIWILDAEFWNHSFLTTEIAKIPEDQIKDRVSDAGFLMSYGTGDVVVTKTSAHLDKYVPEYKQLKARPRTVELLNDMAAGKANIIDKK